MTFVAFPFHGNSVGVSLHCHVAKEVIVPKVGAVGAVAYAHKMPLLGYSEAGRGAPPAHISGQRKEAQPCPLSLSLSHYVSVSLSTFCLSL